MSIAIILKLDTFVSKKDNETTYYTAELSSGQTCFVSETEFQTLKQGRTVFVHTKKYKSESGWKSSSSIIPIDIAV